ncbi:MAG: heat-inducible transcriptional repressor HrcA [Microbacteriaceae bacterium]
MIHDRTLEVLRAIVQDYIASKEPVGSKSLVDKHNFGVSSATIRNDMAILEEEELIVAPHTSSGRVPTDKGYRLFVDRLGEVKPLSRPEKLAIESLFTGSSDLEETLSRTVRLLASLTNQVAMVQFPTLGKSKVRSVEILSVTDSRVLLILVADTGRVEQHMLELGVIYERRLIDEVRSKLSSVLEGQPLAQVQSLLTGFENGFAAEDRATVKRILLGLHESVDANRSEKLLMSGTANLARREGDFTGSITPVLDAIEEQVVLMRLIGEMQADAHGVGLRIGRENQHEGLSEASIMVTGYENQGNEVAKLGVIGPTRMDYASNISAVRAVARYLTKILGD